VVAGNDDAGAAIRFWLKQQQDERAKLPTPTRRYVSYNNGMETLSALDQLFNPAAGWLTPEGAQTLVDWKVSDELRRRIEELGFKANRGTLSEEEDAEYRAYLDDAEVISLLQAKARRISSQSSD
jgi:hypothetical protein